MIRYPFLDSDPTAEVTVTVTDGANPIEDAVVTFTDHDDVGVAFTGETDASGEVVIEVPLETYDVTATATGYVNYEHSAPVVVSGDDTLSIEMVVVTDTLTLTVTDGENVISGATVTIGEDSDTTDANGVVTFELEYGDYSATISADGYVTATESLAFRSNHKNFTVTLESAVNTGTVTVTCQNAGETPLAGADVILYTGDTPPSDQDDSMIVAVGTTGEDGVAEMIVYDTSSHQATEVTDIPFGTYHLIAIKGSNEYSGSLTVDGDEEVTITLTPVNNG